MGYKFNPFTGTFDIAGSGGTADGFLPYDYILVDTSVTIPQYRQMHVHQELTIEGELIIEGSLFILED